MRNDVKKVSSQVALSEQQFPMLVGLNLLIDLILACKKAKLYIHGIVKFIGTFIPVY